jgi:hypothetical protein
MQGYVVVFKCISHAIDYRTLILMVWQYWNNWDHDLASFHMVGVEGMLEFKRLLRLYSIAYPN